MPTPTTFALPSCDEPQPDDAPKPSYRPELQPLKRKASVTNGARRRKGNRSSERGAIVDAHRCGFRWRAVTCKLHRTQVSGSPSPLPSARTHMLPTPYIPNSPPSLRPDGSAKKRCLMNVKEPEMPRRGIERLPRNPIARIIGSIRRLATPQGLLTFGGLHVQARNAAGVRGCPGHRRSRFGGRVCG
ncbi:hypothetical protein MTO96_001975 [Rhipicephalus appendiculatus]